MKINPREIPYKKYRYLYHALFWFVSIALYTIVYGTHDGRYFDQLKINALTLPIKMSATYLVMYVLLPQFLYKRKYLSFFSLFGASAVVFSTIDWFVIERFALSYYYPNTQAILSISFTYHILIGIIHIYPIVIAASAVKIVQLWFTNLETTKQLEKDKIEAELKFLKAQINPHFLFNTLNNLYALTLKKSDEAPRVVLKLSELLDYMLYEGSSNMVSIDNEVKHLQSYIELEKLRYGTRLTFEQHYEGNFNGKYIAPMIIIPFIENSFKHGASSNCPKPTIKLSLKISNNQLEFNLFNNKGIRSTNKTSSEGIGLNNVKRRLELQYQGAYDLKIDEQEDSYSVKLKINLQ